MNAEIKKQWTQLNVLLKPAGDGVPVVSFLINI
jgi:hypothetical protein